MIKIGNTEIQDLPGIEKVYDGNVLVYENNPTPVIPSDYQQVQYIQAAGASALDSEVLVEELDKILFTYSLDSLTTGGDKHIMSCKAGWSGGGLWVENYSSANTWYVRFGSAASSNANPTEAQLTGKHTFELRKNYFGIDGTQVLVPSWSSMPSTTLCIGGRIQTDGVTVTGFLGKIYEVKIYDSNRVLKWWGIPVREANGTGVGLYDAVSGQFFASVSSTPFDAGADIE